jgi:hypothetical protein
MKLRNFLSRIKISGVDVFAEICMPHASQIRQTGIPEVLTWGLILCQWTVALGATVIGTVSTEAKAEIAHAHGPLESRVTSGSTILTN